MKDTSIAWRSNQDEGKFWRRGLQEGFQTTYGPTAPEKASTEDYITRDAGNLFQYFTVRSKNAPFLRRRRMLGKYMFSNPFQGVLRTVEGSLLHW